MWAEAGELKVVNRLICWHQKLSLSEFCCCKHLSCSAVSRSFGYITGSFLLQNPHCQLWKAADAWSLPPRAVPSVGIPTQHPIEEGFGNGKLGLGFWPQLGVLNTSAQCGAPDLPAVLRFSLKALSCSLDSSFCAHKIFANSAFCGILWALWIAFFPLSIWSARVCPESSVRVCLFLGIYHGKYNFSPCWRTSYFGCCFGILIWISEKLRCVDFLWT